MLCNGNVKFFLLLLRKGVYPYEYMESMSNFNEDKLPSIDSFYGKVSSRGISSENYGHAINVWKVFYIKGIGKYHDFYLKCDVSQLMYVKVLELHV